MSVLHFFTAHFFNTAPLFFCVKFCSVLRYGSLLYLVGTIYNVTIAFVVHGFSLTLNIYLIAFLTELFYHRPWQRRGGNIKSFTAWWTIMNYFVWSYECVYEYVIIIKSTACAGYSKSILNRLPALFRSYNYCEVRDFFHRFMLLVNCALVATLWWLCWSLSVTFWLVQLITLTQNFCCKFCEDLVEWPNNWMSDETF